MGKNQQISNWERFVLLFIDRRVENWEPVSERERKNDKKKDKLSVRSLQVNICCFSLRMTKMRFSINFQLISPSIFITSLIAEHSCCVKVYSVRSFQAMFSFFSSPSPSLFSIFIFFFQIPLIIPVKLMKSNEYHIFCILFYDNATKFPAMAVCVWATTSQTSILWD